MDLRTVAAAATKVRIAALGTPVTLTAPDETEYSVKGLVKCTDLSIDPETQVPVHAPRTAVTVAIDTIPIGFDESFEAETIDVQGNPVSGRVIEPQFDRTIGFVTFCIEEIE